MFCMSWGLFGRWAVPMTNATLLLPSRLRFRGRSGSMVRLPLRDDSDTKFFSCTQVFAHVCTLAATRFLMTVG